LMEGNSRIRRKTSALASCLFVLAPTSLGLWSSAARADGAATSAAETLFGEARDLAQKGHFAEACPKFEESQRLDPGIGTEFHLAKCWEGLGKTASAWALFLRVASESRAAAQTERASIAADRAKALEPKLSRLQINVAPQEPMPFIMRDDLSVGRASFGVAIAVDPGKHEVVARAPGKLDYKVQLLVPARAETSSVEIPMLGAAPPALAGSATTPGTLRASQAAPRTESFASEAPLSPHDSTGLSLQSGVAIGLGALGLLGLGAGIYGTVDFKKACPTKEACHGPARTQAAHDRTLAYLGWGVGGTGIASALILLLTQGQDDASRTAWQVTPYCTPSACGSAFLRAW
jgi:hypothetical protein